MTLKHLCILLLAVAVGSAAAQGEDIPIENDNNFPPEHFETNGDTDPSVIEGSGDASTDEPVPILETTIAPLLEDIQAGTPNQVEVTTTSTPEESCPSQCVCNIVGGTNEFVVSCSGQGLTTFPSPLDTRTTALNLQNNKLTEIPKEVSALKNLKILNADNNSIDNLIPGSVSELSKLSVLKLANNRLIEFPQDLKNGFGLTELEELDLGGNDMRTELTPEIFTNFLSLKTLTLPTSTTDQLLEDLCVALKNSLVTVCTESCLTQSHECNDVPENVEGDLLDPSLPAILAHDITDEEGDPTIDSDKLEEKAVSGTDDIPLETITGGDSTKNDSDDTKNEETNPVISNPVQLNTIVQTLNKEIDEGAKTDEKTTSSPVLGKAMPINEDAHAEDSPAKDEGSKIETEVVGATTVNTKTGGVDKSIIGMVVAGMIIVVAGITIKKNWSSIRKRFSSSPRTPTERPGATANGTTPEEVPLQDKSPV